MAHIIQTIAMDFMGWLRGIVAASTYVSSPPGEGTGSVMDTITPKTIRLRSFSASTIKAIWDNKTLTAGFVLGLVITLSIGYATVEALGESCLPALGVYPSLEMPFS
jgi:hypothetical protein